jgi:hypothetical protein
MAKPLSDIERKAMHQAALHRDPEWIINPVINRGLYEEAWEDARDYYTNKIQKLDNEKS